MLAAPCPVLQTASAAPSQPDAIHKRPFCNRPVCFLESTFNVTVGKKLCRLCLRLCGVLLFHSLLKNAPPKSLFYLPFSF